MPIGLTGPKLLTQMSFGSTTYAQYWSRGQTRVIEGWGKNWAQWLGVVWRRLGGVNLGQHFAGGIKIVWATSWGPSIYQLTPGGGVKKKRQLIWPLTG